MQTTAAPAILAAEAAAAAAATAAAWGAAVRSPTLAWARCNRRRGRASPLTTFRSSQSWLVCVYMHVPVHMHLSLYYICVSVHRLLRSACLYLSIYTSIYLSIYLITPLHAPLTSRHHNPSHKAARRFPIHASSAFSPDAARRASAAGAGGSGSFGVRSIDTLTISDLP